MRNVLFTIFVCCLLTAPSVNAVFLYLDLRAKPASQKFTRLSRGKAAAAIPLFTAGVFSIYSSLAKYPRLVNPEGRQGVTNLIANSVILMLGTASTAGGYPVRNEIDRNQIAPCASIAGEFRNQNDIIDVRKQKNIQKWLNNEQHYLKAVFHNLWLKSQYTTNSDNKINKPYVEADKNDLIYKITEDKNGNLIPKKIDNTDTILLDNESKYLIVEEKSDTFLLSVGEVGNISICSYFKPLMDSSLEH